MYSDPVEAAYFEKRLQAENAMAENAAHAEVALAHRGLAACYRAKLSSLLHGEAPPRPVLSLATFRDKRVVDMSQMQRPVGVNRVSAA